MFKAGEWIIMRFPDQSQRIFQLKLGAVFENGRYGRIKTECLIGTKGGLTYWIEGDGSLRKMTTSEISECSGASSGPNLEDTDNRSLIDTNKSQKMTFEEIESLKADCPDRAVIVSSVIEGSSTFETKSAYSQLKYVTRKRRKFLQYVHVSHTSIRTLCAYHISRDPRRALDLRLDSLSLILALGNVQPANFSGTSSKILVWDESHGLLTGSILSKVMSEISDNIGKNEEVVGDQIEASSTISNSLVSRQINYHNFKNNQDAKQNPMIVGVHSEKQLQLPDMMHFNLSDQQRGAFYSVQIAHLDSDKCTFFPDPDNPSIIAESENAERHRAQMSRLLARQSRRRILQEAFSTKLFDTLIIGVTRTDPLALISRLSPFLRGSARLVIYAPFRELVTPAYQELRSRPNHWLDVGLQGSWLRPFQAAPGRIHPLNNCNGGTGSVLYATKAL